MTLNKAKHASDQVTRMTVMLLVISIALLALNRRNSIFFIVIFYWNFNSSSLKFVRYFMTLRIVFLNLACTYSVAETFVINSLKSFCARTREIHRPEQHARHAKLNCQYPLEHLVPILLITRWTNKIVIYDTIAVFKIM